MPQLPTPDARFFQGVDKFAKDAGSVATKYGKEIITFGSALFGGYMLGTQTAPAKTQIVAESGSNPNIYGAGGANSDPGVLGGLGDILKDILPILIIMAMMNSMPGGLLGGLTGRGAQTAYAPIRW